MQELDVVGVRVEMPNNQPIVLLREIDGERFLPIWVGHHEAAAIAHAQQGIEPQRPLTHDLFRDVLQAVGQEMTEVRITDLREGIFFGELVFSSGVEVSARPSDSIALALRMSVRIVCDEQVLGEAGIAIPDDEESQEARIAEFREFLEGVTPEDFERGT